MTPASFDADWVVIGSGFGGSVSALRLAEKGYDVTVLEQGSERDDADMPKSTWDLRRYFYAPRLGLRGIFRITPFKDVLVVSGTGVGGGSLGYAMTLYVPPPAFFADPQWAGLRDWRSAFVDALRSARAGGHGADIARESPKARKAFAGKLDEMIEMLAGQIPDARRPAARKQAIATLVSMMGSLVLARVAGTGELSDEILAAGRDAALACAAPKRTSGGRAAAKRDSAPKPVPSGRD